jgi:apolipoprotein N-acyltransferase
VTVEYLRANCFFLSLPWNFVCHSQYGQSSLLRITSITGMYGVSFLIVMVNQFLCLSAEYTAGRKEAKRIELTSGKPRGFNIVIPAAIVAASLGATLVFGHAPHRSVEQDRHSIRVAVIQPNSTVSEKMTIAAQRIHLEKYRTLSLKAAAGNPDLIIWPASSLPAPLRASRLVPRLVRQIAQESGAYLLVGGSGTEKLGLKTKKQQPNANSEFLFDPRGRMVQQYHKMQLVPFDEYLPLDGILKWPRWITTLEKSFVQGNEYTVFQVAGSKFGAPICWESLFPDLFRGFVGNGANLMINVTNEGLYGRTAAPYQTLAMTVFRAVENSVPVIRCGPTGVSALIRPDGVIAERVRDQAGLDIFVSGLLMLDLELSEKKTLYTRHGDLFAFGCIGFSAFLLFLYPVKIVLGRERRLR